MTKVCKFQQQKEQYSPDSGQTWVDTSVTRAKPGEPIERNSNYCGYQTPSSRTVSDGYMCVGYNKHSATYEEVTYDGGTTWDRIESSIRPGSLVERFSSDCCQLRTVTGTVCTEFMRKANANIEEASLDGETWIQTGRYDVIEYLDNGYSLDCIQSSKVRYFNTSNSGDTDPHYSFGYYNYKTTADTGTGIYVTDRSVNLYSCCDSVTYSNETTGQERMFHYFGNCYGRPFQRNANLYSYRVFPESISSLSGTNVYFESDSFGMICDNSGSFDGITGLTHLDNFENTRYTVIGDATFNNCGLTDVHIPKSISVIGGNAFSNNQNLTSVTIDSGALYPGEVNYLHKEGNNEYSFANCTSLKNVNFNNYSGFITNGMFSGCRSLTGVTIGNPIVIGSYAFNNCSSLASINLGKNLKKIGEKAFYNCTSLTSITIPENCTYFKEAIFNGCTNLTDIYLESWVIDEYWYTDPSAPPSYERVNSFPSGATYHLHCYNVNAWVGILIGNMGVPPQNIQVAETGCVETRWVESGTTCSGYTKYAIEYEQISFAGSNWYDLGNERTTVKEVNSLDCGYVPPLPNDWFVKVENASGQTTGKACSQKSNAWGDYRLVRVDVDFDNIPAMSEYTKCQIQNCGFTIQLIYENTFWRYPTSLRQLRLPSTINTIDYHAIGLGNLETLVIPAVNPPYLNNNTPTLCLSIPSSCKIYVPDESVNSYKTNSDWSTWSDQFYPISDLN